MRPKDIEFKKKCAQYDRNVRNLLKKGNIDEAKKMIDQVALSIREWEEELKSTRFRLNFLRNIYSLLILEENKTNRRLKNGK